MASDLNQLLHDSLGLLYEPNRDYVFGSIWGIIHGSMDHGYNLYWLYLVSSAVIALLIYLAQGGKYERLSPSGFIRFCLPKAVFAHKSAIIDYKFYVINPFVYKIITGGAVFGSAAMASKARSLLQSSFGDGPQWEMTAASGVVYTILAIAAHDLGVTLGHILDHKIPFFWEFHKVHHSAEALKIGRASCRERV